MAPRVPTSQQRGMTSSTAAGARGRRKVVGAYRAEATGELAAKSAVNTWLAGVATAAWQAAGAGGCSTDAAALWSLLLETRELRTLAALKEAGATATPVSTVVPNPCTAECLAMVAAAPGIQAFPCTSHALLCELVGMAPGCVAGQTTKARQLCLAGWPGTFGFIWLDYCGTLASSAGRRRQEDIRAIFEGRLLSPNAILAVTLAERGAPQLFQGELADSLVVCVRVASEAAGQPVELLGVAEYSATSEMVVAAFLVGARKAPMRGAASFSLAGVLEPAGTPRSAAPPQAPPEAPGLRFLPGHSWHPGRGMHADGERPVAMAMRLAAEAFAAAAGPGRALALEASKLLPVTRALEAAGVCSVVSAIADPLEAAIAEAILGRKVRALACNALLAEQVGAEAGCFDAVWLSYERGRSSTSAQLRECADWPQLKELLSQRLLAPCALLTISIAYASTAEIWLGSAVDWTSHGVRCACVDHGYRVGSVSVVRFDANAPRLIVCFRLGESREASVEVPSSLQLALASIPCPGVANFECAQMWDEAREKVPTAEAGRLRAVAAYCVALAQLVKAEAALLHEPGFLGACPALQRALRRVTCCPGGDAVVEAELRRRGCGLLAAGSAGTELLPFAALVLLEDCGPAAWRARWAALARAWLGSRGVVPGALVLLVEASDAGGFSVLVKELLLEAPFSRVHAAVMFPHRSRRWACAGLLAAGSQAGLASLAAGGWRLQGRLLPGRPISQLCPQESPGE